MLSVSLQLKFTHLAVNDKIFIVCVMECIHAQAGPSALSMNQVTGTLAVARLATHSTGK